MDNTQWAKDLTKIKNDIKRRQNVPLEAERKKFDSQLDIYKQRLIVAAENHAFNETKKQYDNLVETLSKKLRLVLEEYREKHNELPDEVVQKYTKLFQQECIDLALACDKLLGVEPAL